MVIGFQIGCSGNRVSERWCADGSAGCGDEWSGDELASSGGECYRDGQHQGVEGFVPPAHTSESYAQNNAIRMEIRRRPHCRHTVTGSALTA